MLSFNPENPDLRINGDLAADIIRDMLDHPEYFDLDTPTNSEEMPYAVEAAHIIGHGAVKEHALLHSIR